MTRKDYIILSKVIKANLDRCYEHPSACVIRDLAEDLATALMEDNPNFDRAKFLGACDLL